MDNLRPLMWLSLVKITIFEVLKCAENFYLFLVLRLSLIILLDNIVKIYFTKYTLHAKAFFSICLFVQY